VEAPGGEKREHLKSGGKQWQAIPKTMRRMRRTRAIPVAWLSSGLCPDRPRGWIPIIINDKFGLWNGHNLGLSKLFPGSMYGENLGVDGRMIIIVVREKSWSIWFRIGT